MLKSDVMVISIQGRIQEGDFQIFKIKLENMGKYAILVMFSPFLSIFDPKKISCGAILC